MARDDVATRDVFSADELRRLDEWLGEADPLWRDISGGLDAAISEALRQGVRLGSRATAALRDVEAALDKMFEAQRAMYATVEKVNAAARRGEGLNREEVAAAGALHRAAIFDYRRAAARAAAQILHPLRAASRMRTTCTTTRSQRAPARVRPRARAFRRRRTTRTRNAARGDPSEPDDIALAARRRA